MLPLAQFQSHSHTTPSPPPRTSSLRPSPPPPALPAPDATGGLAGGPPGQVQLDPATTGDRDWAETAKEVAGAVGVGVKDLLTQAEPLLEIVPVPALGTAVSVLLKAWEQVNQVKDQRHQCLRLIARAASLLRAVQAQLAASSGARESLPEAVQENVRHLETTLFDIQVFVGKQASRRWLKRYLKRGDIEGMLAEYNDRLSTLAQLFDVQSHLALHLRLAQDASDRARDQRALSSLLRASLCNDALLLQQLALQHDETLEAVGAMQHQLGALVSASHRLRILPHAPTGGALRLTMGGSVGDGEREGEGGEVELHRAFLERGIGALKSLSGGEERERLPDWTVSKWEVDRDELVGKGYFATVYRGRWRGSVVAIKELAPETPKDLFLREIRIWQTLRHPHICQFVGASSATANPPWLIVSVFHRNGNALTWLRANPGAGRVRLMHEIALGMAYLHDSKVLHGDLKATNVLISAEGTAMVTDFGLSELRLEVARRSSPPLPEPGALRWRSPERMADGALEVPVDVYAFAITAVELLSLQVPFGHVTDERVYQMVVHHDSRPARPSHSELSDELWDLIARCWTRVAASRPSFYSIAQETHAMLGGRVPSPEVYRREFPAGGEGSGMGTVASRVSNASSSDETFRTAETEIAWGHTQMEVDLEGERGGSDVEETPRTALSPLPRVSFIQLDEDPPRSSTDSFRIARNPSLSPLSSPPDTPPQPMSSLSSPPSRAADRSPSGRSHTKDAKVYAHYLHTYEFDPILRTPLWQPSADIRIGDVGFVRAGRFTPLLNACDELAVLGAPAPCEVIETTREVLGGRSAAQRGFEAIFKGLGGGHRKGSGGKQGGWESSKTFRLPLVPGKKQACLLTSTSTLELATDAKAAREWFQGAAGYVLIAFGEHYGLKREDLILVLGTLSARNYAQLITIDPPPGEMHFDILPSSHSCSRSSSDSSSAVASPSPPPPGSRRPWGVWRHQLSAMPIPNGLKRKSSASAALVSEEDLREKGPPFYSARVSSGSAGEPPAVLLLARLRFRENDPRPTSQ